MQGRGCIEENQDPETARQKLQEELSFNLNV